MKREIYNENNFDHDYFHWNQESLDEATLRQGFWNMVQEGIASIFQKEDVFKQIDEGKTKILINQSKEDIDWQIVKIFLELE